MYFYSIFVFLLNFCIFIPLSLFIPNCSTPSILEKFMEESFTHGFSHKTNGNKLKGKKLILSFTTGAPAEMYHKDGTMKYEIDDFLPCYKAMSTLTRMEYCGYIFTGGISNTT